MFILAIDTSCDETSVAITWNDVVFANVISSQVELHKKYGGVVPMIAMRAHRERIDAVIQEAMKRASVQIANIRFSALDTESKRNNRQQKESQSFCFDCREFGLGNIDIFAVTYGPGLAPALQIGVEKAKELAKRYQKPLVAVDHMEGHIYANFVRKPKAKSSKSDVLNKNQIASSKPQVTRFPVLCLLISGGHTELVLMRGHGDYEILGETLDDAVGEAFDKVAKMLNLGYPGGAIVERLAKEGDPFRYPFPIPLEKSKTLDFSYSGLKTSVLYTLRRISSEGQRTKKQICDVCASFQQAAIGHLVQKTTMAMNRVTRSKLRVTKLFLGGGVVANKLVRSEVRKAMNPFGVRVVYPADRRLIGDNAAMIAIAAYYKAKRKEFVRNVSRLEWNSSLRLGERYGCNV